MQRYHFDIKINKRDNNAGSKATEDCKRILLELGYKNLEIYFIKVWFLMPFNLVKLFLKLLYYFLSIKPNSFIVVQYPLKGINHFFGYFIRLLKIKGCKFSCIIHDIDSLRSEFDNNKIRKEINALTAYDVVISHNRSMSKWLKENGYYGNVEEIILFDYLASIKKKDNNKNNHRDHTEIVFAGSLSRGTFLQKLSGSASLHINLYGPGLPKNVLERNSKLRWYGSFSPEEIINEVEGDFGLIWDGDSIEEITGLTGSYIRYNTPHKTSLYLAAGLPVIISKNAAIATFVEENNIGFCISSLSEIAAKVNAINRPVYLKMKENAFSIGEKLTKGYYLRNALNRIEISLNNK